MKTIAVNASSIASRQQRTPLNVGAGTIVGTVGGAKAKSTLLSVDVDAVFVRAGAATVVATPAGIDAITSPVVVIPVTLTV